MREDHVVDHHLLLGLAVVIVILVYVHLRQGVYFGNELAQVSWTRRGVDP